MNTYEKAKTNFVKFFPRCFPLKIPLDSNWKNEDHIPNRPILHTVAGGVSSISLLLLSVYPQKKEPRFHEAPEWYSGVCSL